MLPDNHQPVPFRIVFPNGAVVEWVDERMEQTKELLGLASRDGMQQPVCGN
ncbi:MAG: hypothetical protein HQL80_12945 [Magnetococcales bacterium]|nr:hypothetical protein [Magnetococcales bacterium]